MTLKSPKTTRAAIFLPLALVLLGFFYALLLRYEVVPLQRRVGDSLGIQDYAFQALEFREFCAARSASPYRSGDQKTVMDREFGQDFKSWMPAGISPAWMLPICGLTHFAGSLASSAALWCLASLAALAAALSLASRRWERAEETLTLVLPILISESFLRAISLGQTSILGAGALVWFGFGSEKRVSWLDLLFASVAALKPTYFVILAICLVGSRGIAFACKVLSAPVILCAVSLAVYGSGVWADYLTGISGFASVMPDVYKPGFSLTAFLTVRSALAPILGQDAALLASKVLSALSLGLAGLWAMALAFRGRPGAGPGAAACLGFLLFAPYAGAYEDILFLAPVLSLLSARELLKVERLFFALSLVFILNFSLLPAGLLWIAAAAKLLCAALMLWKIVGAARSVS